MLARARALDPDLPNVRWLLGDGHTLAGVDDATVDACVSLVVLQHVPDRRSRSATSASLVACCGPGAGQLCKSPTIRRSIGRGTRWPSAQNHSSGGPQRVSVTRPGSAPTSSSQRSGRRRMKAVPSSSACGERAASTASFCSAPALQPDDNRRGAGTGVAAQLARRRCSGPLTGARCEGDRDRRITPLSTAHRRCGFRSVRDLAGAARDVSPLAASSGADRLPCAAVPALAGGRVRARGRRRSGHATGRPRGCSRRCSER